MKNNLLKILLSIALCGIKVIYSQEIFELEIPKKDAQALFAKLYIEMQELHPNLYEYVHKNDYDKAYYEIMTNLDTADTYTASMLFKEFEVFVAICGDSHSGIGLSQKYIKPKKDKDQNSTNHSQSSYIVNVFPFVFKIVNGKMYNALDCFADEIIPLKSEIVSIGNQSTEEWLQEKRKRMSYERDAHKDAVISLNPQYKYLPVDSCEFRYIPYGKTDTLYSILNCSIDVRKYDECLSKITDEDDVVSFRSLDSGRIGIISMYYFYPLEIMLPHIKQVLDSLKFYQTKDLIIDLRMSPGGHAEIVDEMFKRMTDKPFRQCSEEQVFIKFAMQNCSNKDMRKVWQQRKYIKKREVKKNWTARKDTIISYQLSEIQPKNHDNNYTGRIWAMVGPYTNSAAVSIAAMLQDYQLGIVVGEETGGIQNCYGNPMLYPLPELSNNKQIRFYYIAPFIKFIRPSGDDSMKLRGVLPDIIIEPNISYKEDAQLKKLIEIIKQYQ